MLCCCLPWVGGVRADLDYPRYKYMVQVVLGEQRGEGVRCGCRCFWDSDVDRHASEIFMNVCTDP